MSLRGVKRRGNLFKKSQLSILRKRLPRPNKKCQDSQ